MPWVIAASIASLNRTSTPLRVGCLRSPMIGRPSTSSWRGRWRSFLMSPYLSRPHGLSAALGQPYAMARRSNDGALDHRCARRADAVPAVLRRAVVVGLEVGFEGGLRTADDRGRGRAIPQ